MKRHHRLGGLVIAALFLVVGGASARGDLLTSLTVVVDTAPDGLNRYTYTLTNDAASTQSVNLFQLDVATNAGLGSIAEHHPRDVPHFYLFAIGTAPMAQRHGHGGKLLRHVLDRCDAEGLPAYLEASNPVNIAFYEHNGFRLRNKVTLPDGPTLDLMWRDAH